MVALCKLDGQVHAVSGRCPHAAAFLAPGDLHDAGVVQCPLHGARFFLASGAVLEGPAEEGLRTYTVVVEDGVVSLMIENDAGESNPAGLPRAAAGEGRWL